MNVVNKFFNTCAIMSGPRGDYVVKLKRRFLEDQEPCALAARFEEENWVPATIRPGEWIMDNAHQRLWIENDQSQPVEVELSVKAQDT